MGLNGPYENPGPLPNVDHCGYEVAMQMVASSLEKGRYSKSHKQFDTIQRLRSGFSNQFRASAVSNVNSWSFADKKGSNLQRLSMDPCGSIWFSRFMEGCRRRMGQDWRPNRAISVELMTSLLRITESRITESPDLISKGKWIMAGGYFCFCYVVSLRSPEGLLVDLEGMLDHYDDERPDVIITLLGRVKGEHRSRQHLLPCVAGTDSGIQVKVWIQRILAFHSFSGITNGPAFINTDGIQSSTREMNDLFQEVLIQIFDEDPRLYKSDIRIVEDIQEKYNVFRSFRRGSESRAFAKKVDNTDRYVVHRWQKKEAAGKGKVSQPIDQVDVEITLVKAAFLRYTHAM